MSLAVQSISPKIVSYSNQAVNPSFQMTVLSNNKQDNKNQQPSFKEFHPKGCAVSLAIGGTMWVGIIAFLRYVCGVHFLPQA